LKIVVESESFFIPQLKKKKTTKEMGFQQLSIFNIENSDEKIYFGIYQNFPRASISFFICGETAEKQ